jgi:hypothetical protein
MQSNNEEGRQYTCNVTLRRLRATDVAVKKQYALRTLSVFVALGIQHGMRMGLIIICGMSALHYLSTLPHKKAQFSEKLFSHKMCVLILRTTFV